MDIGLMSYFDVSSGYGNSAVEIARAMTRQGINVTPYAYKIDVELPKDFTDLFTKREPENLDAIIVFALPNQLHLTEKMQERIPVKIGYTMWEQTKLTKDLWVTGNPYEPFTEMWVPCKMNIEPFKEFAPGQNFEIMPLGINTKFFKYHKRSGDGPFKFCMNGALGYRKGTFDVINAYKAIRERHPDWDIELHLKTSTKGMLPQMEKWAPGLKVYNQMFWLAELIDFYNRMDCMVAPSRGEGFHQPPLEFLSTGGIVITTTWGGMESWYDEQWAYPVKHQVVEVGMKWPGALPGSMWAEPEQESIEAQMEYVYLNQDEAFAKAFKASNEIPAIHDWDVAVKRMVKRIGDLLD